MKLIAKLLILFVIATTTKAQTTYEKQIRDITTELGKKVAETDKKRVAVADFTDLDGTVIKLGRFIAEEFNTYLPEAGHGLEVIDRSRINMLIKENQMLRKGLTDPSAAAKLGQLAGVNALIFGTLTTFGESVRLNIKILDIQRGVVIRSMIGNITRTADINKLLSELSSPDLDIDSDPDQKQEPEPKPEQSKNKNCGKSHVGGYYFYNTTKKDVLISWHDGMIGTMNIIVRAGNKHFSDGLYAGSNGSGTYQTSLYRDISKKENAEHYSIFIEECQNKTLIIK
jgi:TolB-like protein